MDNSQDTALSTQQPEAEVRPLMATPWEHGVAAGHIKTGRRNTFFGDPNEPVRSPEFRAAETLHGWSAHKSHTADRLEMSREDYDLAIVAANETNADGSKTPYVAALAPHLRSKGGE